LQCFAKSDCNASPSEAGAAGGEDSPEEVVEVMAMKTARPPCCCCRSLSKTNGTESDDLREEDDVSLEEVVDTVFAAVRVLPMLVSENEWVLQIQPANRSNESDGILLL